MTEHDEQASLFSWKCAMLDDIPQLGMLVGLINQGKRSPWEARQAKAEGLTAGLPDVALFTCVPPYGGLFMEFKAENGRLSKEQRSWAMALPGNGYAYKTVYSFEEAKAAILAYLDGRWDTMVEEDNND